jgi:hypothetical protein
MSIVREQSESCQDRPNVTHEEYIEAYRGIRRSLLERMEMIAKQEFPYR